MCAQPRSSCAPHALTGFRMDTDGWVSEYDVCKELTQDIVQVIQVGFLSLGALKRRGSEGWQRQSSRRGWAWWSAVEVYAGTVACGVCIERAGAMLHEQLAHCNAAALPQPPPLPHTDRPTKHQQERNINHPDGGPEASRMTAAARRKLGTLGTSLDSLFRWLDSPEAAAL